MLIGCPCRRQRRRPTRSPATKSASFLAVTLLAAAGVQSAHAASPTSSTIAIAATRDRAAETATRRGSRPHRANIRTSCTPDAFNVSRPRDCRRELRPALFSRISAAAQINLLSNAASLTMFWSCSCQATVRAPLSERGSVRRALARIFSKYLLVLGGFPPLLCMACCTPSRISSRDQPKLSQGEPTENGPAPCASATELRKVVQAGELAAGRSNRNTSEPKAPLRPEAPNSEQVREDRRRDDQCGETRARRR